MTPSPTILLDSQPATPEQLVEIVLCLMDEIVYLEKYISAGMVHRGLDREKLLAKLKGHQ